MKIITRNGYISAWGELPFGDDVTDEEYNALLDTIRSKPSAENGFDYRLKANLEWERYELPIIEEEQTAYTAEQLEQMTSSELREICAELGISGSMSKANMIDLILYRQRGDIK